MNGTDSSSTGNAEPGFQGPTPAPASGSRRVPVLVWVLVGGAAFFFICIIPILALLAIPALGSVKNHANESAAIKSIQTIEQAEMMYSETYPTRGYTCSLRALGGDANAGQPSADAAQLLRNDLATGNRDGYIFTLSNCAKVSLRGTGRVTGYAVTAVPVTPGKTGHRGFCSDESGVIKYDPTGGANCTQPMESR
jgi:type IV pilus assembly protein PilA